MLKFNLFYFVSMKEGDEKICIYSIYIMEIEYEMNMRFCFLEVKYIFTRERFGNYCMKIFKVISFICNCNKEGKKESWVVISFERYSKNLKESISF